MSGDSKDLVPSDGRHLQHPDEGSIAKRGLELANRLSGDLEAVGSDEDSLWTMIKDFQKIKIMEIREKRRMLFNDHWDDSSRERDWKALIRSNPEMVEPYYRLGNAFFEKGKYRKAIQYYTIVLGKQPDFIDALRRRGDSYYAELSILGLAFKTSKTRMLIERAMSDYQAAAQLAQDVYSQNAMGILYQILDDHEKALVCFTRAVKLAPDYSESYYNRASTLIKLNRNREALSDIEKYISSDPWHDRETEAATEKLALLRSQLSN